MESRILPIYLNAAQKSRSMTTPKVARKAADKPTAQGEPMLPRAQWRDVLREVTLEVFSTMTGITLTFPAPSDEAAPAPASADASLSPHVTGMIGIAGAMRAVFSLRCSDRAAITIASQMLMISLEEAAAQKCDAIGEVSNMIAGHFKRKIGSGSSCTLTVPTVVVGGNYTIHCLEKGERLEFPVTCEGESLLVTLDIRS
jgi:chemotaxis protein CheX